MSLYWCAGSLVSGAQHKRVGIRAPSHQPQDSAARCHRPCPWVHGQCRRGGQSGQGPPLQVSTVWPPLSDVSCAPQEPQARPRTLILSKPPNDSKQPHWGHAGFVPPPSEKKLSPGEGSQPTQSCTRVRGKIGTDPEPLTPRPGSWPEPSPSEPRGGHSNWSARSGSRVCPEDTEGWEAGHGDPRETGTGGISYLLWIPMTWGGQPPRLPWGLKETRSDQTSVAGAAHV